MVARRLAVQASNNLDASWVPSDVVVSHDDAMSANGLRCPHCAQKRTSGLAFSMSALGHKRTQPSYLSPALMRRLPTVARKAAAWLLLGQCMMPRARVLTGAEARGLLGRQLFLGQTRHTHYILETGLTLWASRAKRFRARLERTHHSWEMGEPSRHAGRLTCAFDPLPPGCPGAGCRAETRMTSNDFNWIATDLQGSKIRWCRLDRHENARLAVNPRAEISVHRLSSSMTPIRTNKSEVLFSKLSKSRLRRSGRVAASEIR